MMKESVFHQRRIFFAKLNGIENGIPILVGATTEELCHAKNHFNMTEEEQKLSRLQLFIKKGKMFGYNDKLPVTKLTGLADKKFFGKPQPMSPVSIMQNEELFLTLKDKANTYLEKILKIPTKENEEETYLQKIVDRLYGIIQDSNPSRNEIIHLATMEKDLASPDVGKNRLTAEFGTLLITELRNKIAKNHDLWQVELDRVLALKQYTSRAESYGIHRIAQQPLMLYQARDIKEQISSREKVIIVDDHIQAGAAISCAVSEIMNSGANLLGIACATAHKNNQFFNIQPDVIEFITSLLPQGLNDLDKLNEALKYVGLSIQTLTNIEGMILSSILCDSKNQDQKIVFENLLKKYDASKEINHSLFENQTNSLMEEFEKPKVEFENFEKELIAAVEKGRYTVPYKKQIVLSDEDGQNIRKDVDKRANLPWLLFDFDNTLHALQNHTFIIFQSIIKNFSGVEVPLETIEKKRQILKDEGQYQYQEMLLSFIKENNPKIQISCEEITNKYQEYKSIEPFEPKMSKEDFLELWNKYKIGIITDGSTFESKLEKIKAFYGVGIDGYVNSDQNLPKKPNAAMFQEFCKKYDVETKPVAYVGDREDLDGVMAKNANLRFISVDPSQPMIDMEKFKRELNEVEERIKAARNRWGLLRNVVRLIPEVREEESAKISPVR